MFEIEKVDELVIGAETKSLSFGIRVGHVKKLVIYPQKNLIAN